MDRERGIGRALGAWPLLVAAGAILSVLFALLGGLGPTATRLAPRDADELAYARRLVETGRFADAEARLRALLEARPHVAAAHALLAESIIAAVRAGAAPSPPLLDRAWRSLSAARALGHDVAVARREIADLLLERGWAREAVLRYRELLPAAAEGLVEALEVLAFSDPSTREACAREALEVARSVLKSERRTSLAQARFQRLKAKERDDLKGAQGTLASHISEPFDPLDLYARMLFENCSILVALGQEDAAAVELADALAEGKPFPDGPRRREASLLQALLEKDLGKMVQAVHQVAGAQDLQAFGCEPGTVTRELRRAAGALGKDDPQVTRLSEAVGHLRRHFPEHPHVALDYAFILKRLRRHSEAGEAFAAAAEMPCMEPADRAQALRDAAAAYASGDHHALAARTWGQVGKLAERPEQKQDAAFRRADELRLAGSWEESLAAFDEYLAPARTGHYRTPEAFLHRGLMLEDFGRIEEALAAYAKVLGDPSISPATPEWAKALFHRGRLLLARGDRRSSDEGREALEEHVDRYAAQPRPPLEAFEAGVLLVRAAVVARRPEEARDLLAKIEATASRLPPAERTGAEEHLARARRLAERKGGP